VPGKAGAAPAVAAGTRKVGAGGASKPAGTKATAKAKAEASKGPAAAKPARARRRAAPRPAQAAPDPVQRLVDLITTSLEDDKAEDVVVIDLAGKASFADRMVIASGKVARHLGAMAEHLLRRLKEAGVRRVSVEGAGSADWLLIDAGDVVVHLFRPETRALYNLEKMWGVALPEAVTVRAAG